MHALVQMQLVDARQLVASQLKAARDLAFHFEQSTEVDTPQGEELSEDMQLVRDELEEILRRLEGE